MATSEIGKRRLFPNYASGAYHTLNHSSGTVSYTVPVDSFATALLWGNSQSWGTMYVNGTSVAGGYQASASDIRVMGTFFFRAGDVVSLTGAPPRAEVIMFYEMQ